MYLSPVILPRDIKGSEKFPLIPPVGNPLISEDTHFIVEEEQGGGKIQSMTIGARN